MLLRLPGYAGEGGWAGSDISRQPTFGFGIGCAKDIFVWTKFWVLTMEPTCSRNTSIDSCLRNTFPLSGSILRRAGLNLLQLSTMPEPFPGNCLRSRHRRKGGVPKGKGKEQLVMVIVEEQLVVVIVVVLDVLAPGHAYLGPRHRCPCVTSRAER